MDSRRPLRRSQVTIQWRAQLSGKIMTKAGGLGVRGVLVGAFLSGATPASKTSFVLPRDEGGQMLTFAAYSVKEDLVDKAAGGCGNRTVDGMIDTTIDTPDFALRLGTHHSIQTLAHEFLYPRCWLSLHASFGPVCLPVYLPVCPP